MGLYGSAPEPPDPQQTAAAQTATNLSTAVANSYLGNINQVTPDGRLTYSQTGSEFVNDPNGTKYWTNGDKYVTGDRSGQEGWRQVTGYEVPTFTATTELSKMQQAIKEQEDHASLNLAELARTQSNRLQNVLDGNINLADAPRASNPENLDRPDYQRYTDGPDLQSFNYGPDLINKYDADIDTSRYERALMDRMNPQLEQDRAALESRLINQGLQPGSEAYNRAIDQASRQRNDARMSAILNAGQEQSRLANLARDQASFTNNARQQEWQNRNTTIGANNAARQQEYQNANTAISGNNALEDQAFNARRAKNSDLDAARARYLAEQYAKRNQSINEITSLMSGAQVQSPDFVQTNPQTMPTVDYAGLVNQNYENRLAAYQQQQQGIGSLLGGIGNLFAMSDRRAKKDIEKVGTLKGMTLYEYSMRGLRDDGKRHIGVMAQEAEKKKPGAVVTGRDGLKRVDYGRLFAAGDK